MSNNKLNTTPLLRLPTEIRLQIYEWVIPRRVVYVRMKWVGRRYTSQGFTYSCLEDTQPLQEKHESNTLSQAVPFGAEMRLLGQTCRQIYQETALMPYKTFIWAFESTFTLDEWLFTKDCISTEHKKAIRTVAVPFPGPYRSSEEFLLNLQEIIMIGTAYSTTTVFTRPEHEKTALEVTTLKKNKESKTWITNGKRAQYAKDLFV